MTTNKTALYSYLFHFNPYEDLWYAFRREEYTEYFNGKKDHLRSNKDLNKLIKEIIKHEPAEL